MTAPQYIEHIVEPDKLLLSWLPSKASGHSRLRRFVAELISDGDNIRLEYLLDSEDFAEATKIGFKEYPGFSRDTRIHNNVLSAFMRRLPPHTRNDFGKYLAAIRINPADKDSISDFALLGYSGAILPGDGFTVINAFGNAKPPFEFLLQIQGYRHRQQNLPYQDICHGMQVTFQPEPQNIDDPEAIMMLVSGKHVGYVCRGINKSFHNWTANGYDIEAVIERINGTEDNPKIYAFVKVS